MAQEPTPTVDHNYDHERLHRLIRELEERIAHLENKAEQRHWHWVTGNHYSNPDERYPE